jgi:hypothetical protein
MAAVRAKTRTPTGVPPHGSRPWLDLQKPFLAAIDACVFQGMLHPVWKSDTYLLLEVQTRPASGRISSLELRPSHLRLSTSP